MHKVEVFKKQFFYYKSLAEKAIEQLEDHSLFAESEEGSNSISVIMKHMAGNMRSRWTNIFVEDGEKEWRNRDDEFVDSFSDKKELLDYWESGWKVLMDTLNGLEESDLERIIYIRNMGTTVHDAIIRQLCHYSYHVGQIVYAAKSIKGVSFTSLSIPKGASKSFNEQRFEKPKSIMHFTDDTEQ